MRLVFQKIPSPSVCRHSPLLYERLPGDISHEHTFADGISRQCDGYAATSRTDIQYRTAWNILRFTFRNPVTVLRSQVLESIPWRNMKRASGKFRRTQDILYGSDFSNRVIIFSSLFVSSADNCVTLPQYISVADMPTAHPAHSGQ